MKIKRFFAKDMRSALLQVKEEFGSEAVIMSNKKITGGVEIVAAVDGEQVNTYLKSKRNSELKSSPTQLSSYSPMTQSILSQLKTDKVSLKSKFTVDTTHSVERFANLLKNYGENSHQMDFDKKLGNEDSLSAPLKRPSNKNVSNSDGISPDSKSVLTQLISKGLEGMHEEMTSIRRLLEEQVSGLMWQEIERREPLRAMLIKRLERMGVASELADQLACYIPENTPPTKAWKALLGLVADQIPVSKNDILKHGGIVALLGPTGVGKTTTIAKLATRAAMEYGSDNVALVSTDTYRIGAYEQLSIYGKIMGSPVKIAKNSNELADIVYQLRNRRLILVDTAGMGQRDVRLSEQLDTLIQESGEVIHSYLVLSATAQREVLQETIEHFRKIPLAGCIMTKLDESLGLGEFVSVIVQNALPVVYIANGQRVPEDIVLAQPKYMVEKASELLEKSIDNKPHYWNHDLDDGL
ncbi:flagellar biosynthesis protein [Candidatus Photodesmus blepharus]|uniref:Flagellar biosynthesis protein FlhF n=1 Tax=Candidatus Photodesmus blepharonis TaxID=1179155 RepID=A0A084CMW3_9GAMM|nr:flagellar biosynthesis protein FlhF [Candidatus Photodesmus blepharus]KEY91142.1 flagellar biosynthesis protein [Candidatus Photodesmus blepharus]